MSYLLWGFVGGIIFVGIVKLLYMFGSYLLRLGDDVHTLKIQADFLRKERDDCHNR